MGGRNDQTRQIDVHLKTLIRGLSQENVHERYEGYKSLYEIGLLAIPQIREALLKSKWEKVKYPGEIRYVSGLFSLLHDISEGESEKVERKIIDNGCDSIITQTIKSIRNFTVADYHTYYVKGIKIFEHKGIQKRSVRGHLENWLKNVPDEDLREVERLYVVVDDGRDSLGSYTPILFNIKLVWDITFSHLNPLSWVLLLNVEHTLYHEVGHHKHRHTFGQQPEQEKEANAYARNLIRKSHPILGALANVIDKGLVLIGLRKKPTKKDAA